jgi:hypothetical protein
MKRCVRSAEKRDYEAFDLIRQPLRFLSLASLTLLRLRGTES